MNRFYINFEPKQTGGGGSGIKQTDSNPLYMRQVQLSDSHDSAQKDSYSENNSKETRGASQNAESDENNTENDPGGYGLYGDSYTEAGGGNYPGVQNNSGTLKEPDTYSGGSMTFGGKYQKPDNIIVSDRDPVYEPPQNDMGNKNNIEQTKNNDTNLTEDGRGSTGSANGAGPDGDDDSGANPGLNPPFDLYNFPGIGIKENTNARSSASCENMGAGSMIVQVFLAKQAIPLEGAKVLIESSSDNPDNIPPERYELYTDGSGRTPEVMLWAPSALISQSSGSTAVPYALYDISVSKEGYYNVYFKNATVFDGIVSIQNVEALPLGENGSHNAMVEEDNVFDETNEDIL